MMDFCSACSIILFFLMTRHPPFSFFFFFNDTATTEIYTLSLHDALPILESAFCRASENRPIAGYHGIMGMPTNASLEKQPRSEEHTSELQSPCNLVCRLLLEKKKKKQYSRSISCSRHRCEPH